MALGCWRDGAPAVMPERTGGKLSPSPPPGNRWLRNPSSSEVTDETDFGTVGMKKTEEMPDSLGLMRVWCIRIESVVSQIYG